MKKKAVFILLVVCIAIVGIFCAIRASLLHAINEAFIDQNDIVISWLEKNYADKYSINETIIKQNKDLPVIYVSSSSDIPINANTDFVLTPEEAKHFFANIGEITMIDSSFVLPPETMHAIDPQIMNCNHKEAELKVNYQYGYCNENKEITEVIFACVLNVKMSYVNSYWQITSITECVD